MIMFLVISYFSILLFLKIFRTLLYDTNNLNIVVWFQVFLSNTNNLYTVI